MSEKKLPGMAQGVVEVTTKELPDGSKSTKVEVDPSVSGAAAGAAAGAVVAGPAGALVGGVLGAIFGPGESKEYKK